MAPSRKPKIVNKRFSNILEAASSKDKDADISKNRQQESPGNQKKRKLTDMLGPQWSKEELEHFYEAYRKHGKDWKKVAAAVRNRSLEMVEALYSMNRAYLSLPEGTASVVGLIAMMTDHYSVLEGSDSGEESKDNLETSRKPQKCKRGKCPHDSFEALDGHFSDHSQSHSVASGSGCLSMLKTRHFGMTPHAVRKRTPRVPVSYSISNDNGKKFSPTRKYFKQMVDTNNVADKIAFALTETSYRGGSSNISGTLNKKTKGTVPSPGQNSARKHVKSEIAEPEFRSSDLEEGSSELRIGSAEGDKGRYSRKISHCSSRERARRGRHQEKKIKLYQKLLTLEENVNKHVDNTNKVSSGTDEDKNLDFVKSDFDADIAAANNARSSYKNSWKNSKKILLEEDEGSAFDALKTLADLSMMMPVANSDNADGAYQLNDELRKKKQKSLKNDESHTDCHLGGTHKTEATDEKKPMVKGKRSSVWTPHSRQLKAMKPPGNMSLSTDDKGDGDDASSSPIKVSSSNQLSLVNKGSQRRKMEKPKPMGNLINCLSSHQTRRWCTFEWFYSAIDFPWFAKREFMEYLDHVGLGHVPRLTRIEWGVIRSSLGRPRRFSKQFLIEEKNKLYQYRESVRTHYAELLAGTREGLPADLAPPLLVGQHVIAIHPKTREIYDGSILTVDKCRFRVQFDQPELGVEYVMDIDCMPLNPFENMPVSLISRNVTSGKLNENLTELRLNGKLNQGKTEEHNIFSPGENSDKIEGLYVSPSTHGTCNLLKQRVSLSSKLHTEVVCSEIGNAQLAESLRLSPLAHVHLKEADVLAVSELSRALDKKELVLSELKHMNDEVLESQKFGHKSVKDSEHFKKHYAAVLLQLNEMNEQVSFALFCLRQRNTYQGSSLVFSLKPMVNADDPGGQASSSSCPAFHIQESISHIAEIVESSRRKAQTMVAAAVQAMSYFRKTEIKVERIEEAINFINNWLSVNDPAAPGTGLVPQNQLTASTPNSLASSHVQDSELSSSSDQNEAKIPSELISHCLATLLMIQKCTERQFPPADVAQVLDAAVTSLRPFCSKNLPVYGEIQKCMGIIRSQILALVPT